MEYAASLTPLDEGLAYAFAMDQVYKKTCTDPKVVKAFCKDTGECLQWRSTPAQQLWTRPRNYTNVECKTDEDCMIHPDTAFQPQCRMSTELGKKVCAFDPEIGKDITGSGTCEIVSQKKCEEFSKNPFNCDPSGFFCDLSSEPDARYFEWRKTEYVKCDNERTPCAGVNSTCLPSGECTCVTDDDCRGSAKCQDSTRTPGQKVCQGGGRCVFGNYMLKNWCENPKARCQPQPKPDAKSCTKKEDCATDEYCINLKCVGPKDIPKECQDDTRVPPFTYDKESGRCFINQPYCTQFVRKLGVTDGRTCTGNSDCVRESDWESKFKAFFTYDSRCRDFKCTSDAKACTSKSDCASDEQCVPAAESSDLGLLVFGGAGYAIKKLIDAANGEAKGFCTGPRSQCGGTIGGEFAGMNPIEMTIGKTAYSSVVQNPEWGKIGKDTDAGKFFKGFDCKNRNKNRETFEILEDVFLPVFNNIPATVTQLVDDRMIFDKQLVSLTYAEPLKLYMIIWLDPSYNPCLGFTASEVRKAFPNLLKEIDGKWHIVMKWKDLKKGDRSLKRIYMMCCMGSLFTSEKTLDLMLSTLDAEEREKIDRIINSDS